MQLEIVASKEQMEQEGLSKFKKGKELSLNFPVDGSSYREGDEYFSSALLFDFWVLIRLPSELFPCLRLLVLFCEQRMAGSLWA